MSLLDQKYTQRIKKIGKILKNEAGLSGITQFPHFTWHARKDYEYNKIEDIIKELCEIIPPFNINTAGLGIFAGSRPVLYVKIVTTNELLNIHSKIFQKAQTISNDSIISYDEPENWVPHITLALGDITKDNIGKAIKLVAFRRFHWKIRIDNLSFYNGPKGEIGTIKYQFPLKG
ncbi:MAG: hypothetical protein GY870_19100 [archaeon]|nr:hypothetical protein [archaeon]